MKNWPITINVGLSVLLAFLWSFGSATAGSNDAGSTYLTGAESYTVKVRTRVKYPPMKDNKGSHTGAGFLIDATRGWIATNAHVSSRNPESLEIAFKDQSFFDAQLLFVDRYLDLAVLQAPKKQIPAGAKQAQLRCNDWPEVGSEVGAYGHPLSLDFSVTTGIVSGLRYRHNRYWIQTDAAINRGNSGGPLISIKSGEVVGINALGYSKRSSEGLGFAVPMVYACRVFKLLREGRDPSVPYLPAAFATSDEVRDKLIVATTFDELPVKWALKPGDQLVALAIEPKAKLKNQADLIHALRGSEGDIAVNILRNGKTQNLTLPVLARPRMTDWVGLHFSGMVVGKELMRDVNLSNPNDEIMILDVASASVGSVLRINAYSYLYTVDSLRLKNIKKLCAHLKQAEGDDRKVKLVTRRRAWEYMSASKYDLYKVRVKDVKLVGPRVKEDAACPG
ncbi:trypsin-like peptidase domain-containing protein [Alphaproteobacteria bacterium]|nr:trypsin-like peptidase domain-containing protein [Alphaproteobacteria bacterium]